MATINTINETDNEIFIAISPTRKFVKGSRRWIKHVLCEDAYFHTLSWNRNGSRCSEPACIVNKPPDEKLKY